MKRLHELTLNELDAWAETRLVVGQEKYGESHLQRYSLVDVAEELLDAINIIHLFFDRADSQEYEVDEDVSAMLGTMQALLQNQVMFLQMLDERLPDELCTDEKGGERVWFGAADNGEV